MDIAVVGLEDCVKIVGLVNRAELVTFNIPAACAACVDNEIFVAHKEKPLLYRYQLHCSVQTPQKLVLPDKISCLHGSHCGGYLFAGVQHSLYVWCTATSRCLSVSSRHYQPITMIRSDPTFTVTASKDGFVCVYLTSELLQVHGPDLKPKCVINAHSLPLTDVVLKCGIVYTASIDFSVKVWDLTPLTNIENKKQVQQGKLLKTTIQYPEPIKSIDVDKLSTKLVASGESGKIYFSIISTVQSKVDTKVDHKVCKQLRYNLGASELLILEDKQLVTRCAQSQTILKTISFSKPVDFFFVELDSWGLLQKRQGPSRRNAQNKPLAHQVTTEDYCISFESTRKIHCPLMDIVGYHELSVESKEFNSNEAELKKRIAQLESKNEELYKKLVNSHLN